MLPFEEHKKKVEDEIVEEMIRSLEAGRIKEEDLPIISSYVLEKIDGLTTNEELQLFLHELANKWAIFKSLVVMDGSVEQEKKEQEAIQGALALLEHGKIESALLLAKSATNSE